ncbi:MAG: hypothetical protein OEU36_09480 [Gammaproteobacteria bacterium]|nr:hypothetical protein [Gammaproteobacteria bacterium]
MNHYLGHNIMGTKLKVAVALAIGLAYPYAVSANKDRVDGQIDTITQMLQTHPEMVIDLTAKSGEYCLNTWKVGGGHMTHYATDPSSTTEDVIDFVKADSFTGNMDLDNLPQLPAELGDMEPNKWYYLPTGSYDPHHQTKFPFPLLIRSTNVQ